MRAKIRLCDWLGPRVTVRWLEARPELSWHVIHPLKKINGPNHYEHTKMKKNNGYLIFFTFLIVWLTLALLAPISVILAFVRVFNDFLKLFFEFILPNLFSFGSFWGFIFRWFFRRFLFCRFLWWLNLGVRIVSTKKKKTEDSRKNS